MLRTRLFSAHGVMEIPTNIETLRPLLANPPGMLWVDMVGEPPEICEPLLRQAFGFHPLAIDDALTETHLPKVDNWQSYLYIVLEAIEYLDGEDVILPHEVDVFLGKGFIVTHHDEPLPALERVWAQAARDPRYVQAEADHLLYSLTDELVVDYVRVMDKIDEDVELLEDEVFSNPRPALAQRLVQLKRATLQLRRTLSPMREVLNKLARDDNAVIDARDQVYFRDVYDHLVRLTNLAEGLRDLVGGALETYLAQVNNRMNDIVKTLTVITTLFMPISFMTGFFGMNFFGPVLPGLAPWTAEAAFGLALFIIVMVPLAMFVWMRRQGWM